VEIRKLDAQVKDGTPLTAEQKVQRQEILDYFKYWVDCYVNKKKNIWRQFCKGTKGMSDRLALTPYIEGHFLSSTWWWSYAAEVPDLTKDHPWIVPGESQVTWDNWGDILQKVLREYQLTRIFGWKGHGASKLGKKKVSQHPLLLKYRFPYGDDKDTRYQMAVMANPYTSGPLEDWNINKKYSNKEILSLSYDKEPEWNLIAEWSLKNNMGVWCDHWYTAATKDNAGRHSRSAALATAELYYRRLRAEEGVAMSGPFWAGLFIEDRRSNDLSYPHTDPYKVQLCDAVKRAHGLIPGEDLDGDGLLDVKDTDGDGLADYIEVHPAINTDPNNPDTDGDGLEDGFDLNMAEDDPRDADSDDDGLTDLEDYKLFGYQGTTNPDMDNDGISDGDEVAAGTNPLVNETGSSPKKGKKGRKKKKEK
jgi:hypothetical protein